jgi:hypothetical protein
MDLVPVIISLLEKMPHDLLSRTHASIKHTKYTRPPHTLCTLSLSWSHIYV